MKKLLMLLALVLPTLLLAQLPTNNPSFTVFQRVGTGEVEFTFKPVSLNEPIESMLSKEKAYYPGGRTFFIVRTNKDMTFSEMALPKGNYVGGFKMMNENIYLSLEPEVLTDSKSDMEESLIYNFPLERLAEFECRIQNQAFMIFPNAGGINYSAVTFVIGDQSFFLTIGINDDDLFSQIKNEISKSSKKDSKKYLEAARYTIDARIKTDETSKWLEMVMENDPKNWEGYFLMAKNQALFNDYTSAVKTLEKTRMLILKNRYLNEFQKNEKQDEVDSLIKEWSSKI